MSKFSRLHDVSWQLHPSPLTPGKLYNVDCFPGLFVHFLTAVEQDVFLENWVGRTDQLLLRRP
jgi:hypothetical protein